MLAEVERFFSHDVAAFTTKLAELDRKIDPSAVATKDELFDDLLQSICTVLRACQRLEREIDGDTSLVKQAQDRFRSEIAPWFDRSWFMQRAKVKPRGYPGDYALLSAIYDRQPKSTGLGGYLDVYFLNTTLGRAVVNRMQAARRFLIGEFARRAGTVEVWNVACGPCREYAGGMDLADGDRIHVRLIDSDTEALEYVQASVIAGNSGLPRMECTCYNALRMRSAEQNIRRFGRCDILYSIGLCDYIPDKHLIAMLEGWRSSLSEDGVLYVALKDCERYDKTKYQWLTDWYFFQRTEEDCRELFRHAGFDVLNMEMDRDETGSIMNFVSRVQAPARSHAPAPHGNQAPHVAPIMHREATVRTK